MKAHGLRPVPVQAPPAWQRLNRLTGYALVPAIDDQAARLLLLDRRASGSITVRWARHRPAPAPSSAVLAAVGPIYRAARIQAPTGVHLVHGDRGGPWLTLLRCTVGPLASVTDHVQAEAGWLGAVRIGLSVLGVEPAEDPEYVAVLVEHAITRAENSAKHAESGSILR